MQILKAVTNLDDNLSLLCLCKCLSQLLSLVYHVDQTASAGILHNENSSFSTHIVHLNKVRVAQSSYDIFLMLC